MNDGGNNSFYSSNSTNISSATPANQGFDIGFFATANHPIACLFHVLFKGASLFSYVQVTMLNIFRFLFLNWFLGNEILAFMSIILFAAFDFWAVKNVTGRILVGLRWWSELDENGNEKWIFESKNEDK